MPYRQTALLLVDIEEGLGEVALHLGEGNRHERMSRTVCIPKRERGIIGEVCLMHLAVGAAILAVYVVELRARGHKMIHRGVENALLCAVVGLYLDAGEFAVPSLISLLNGCVEVPTCQLCLHVQLSLVDAHRRERHLHEQRLGVVGYRHNDALHRVETMDGDGLREVDREIDAAVGCPTV